jgi:putative peptidoglycan lipid II flippase
MAVGTTLSRITGLARIVALSYALGIAPLADAYNLANTTPNMVYDLVVGGILSATLVPVFVQHVQREGEDGWRGVQAVVSMATVVLGAATFILAVIAPWVVRAYTAQNSLPVVGSERDVATTLLRLFAPQVFFYGMLTVAAAMLNTRRRFAAPMFAPIANNLVVIAVLLGAGTWARHLPVSQASSDTRLLLLLGIGTTLGVAVQLAVLLPSLRRAHARFRWHWEPSHPAVRQVIRLSGWTLGIVITNQVALFTVLLLANSEAGGVSAYTYAYAFFQLPYAVIAVSIMTARQPGWAAAWSIGDLTTLRREVSRGLRTLLAIIVPVAALFAAVAVPAVRLVLGHGATTSHEASQAGQLLAILTLGLPGFCAFLYFVRVYQAMQDTRTPFRLYVVENAINIAVAALLYRPAGVRGVAASVAIAYTVAALLTAQRLNQRLPVAERLLGYTPASALRRALLFSLPAGFVGWASWHVVKTQGNLASILEIVIGTLMATAVAALVLGLTNSADQTRALNRRRRRPARKGAR